MTPPFCAGPCQLKAAKGGYSNFGSTINPAREYQRGQQFVVKYHRNNHGPGGFIRLSLVTLKDAMSKNVHTRNAFHYSCWGAFLKQAGPNELSTDRFGFNFVGNDGELHSAPRAYYQSFATVPRCVPDGVYILGWVWFGGTSLGPIKDNRPRRPDNRGFFSDYWACSYVRIKGGASLTSSCDPVFVNDMMQFSTDGCMAGNDSPGVCSYEPCISEGFYRKPQPFKDGSKPPSLTPSLFQ